MLARGQKKKKNGKGQHRINGMGDHLFCNKQFSQEETDSITICSLVTAILSVIGSSFLLENFFLYDKGRNPLTKLVACLAFGDYLAAINVIITSLLLLHFPDLYTWSTCVALRAWFQIAAGTTWCYTSAIAFFLYRFMMTRHAGAYELLTR